MSYSYQGDIAKMLTALDDTVEYRLPVGDQVVALNPLEDGED